MLSNSRFLSLSFSFSPLISSHVFFFLPNQWICKPAASSCGRGIKLIDRARDIPESKKYIVQKLRSSLHRFFFFFFFFLFSAVHLIERGGKNTLPGTLLDRF